jgi:murein DD-endopeptidase MepM/ murein hydrolase activator NlpD
VAQFNEILDKYARDWFPERQILLRGPGRVASVTLSQRSQIMGATALAASILWTGVTTLSLGVSSLGKAAAIHHNVVLQDELAAAQLQVADLTAANLRISEQRDAAIAQADATRDAALAQATAARDEATAETNLIQTNTSDEINALNRQTVATISTVDSIIRATGLNPEGLARITPAQPADASAPGDAQVLRSDLGRLKALGKLLSQVPLGPPVKTVSVSSPFGYRPDPWTGAREFHVGVDLRGPIGTDIYATAPGVVSFAGIANGYGEMVQIEHGYGLMTRYSHLDKILVHVGEPVKLHEVIGLMGNTGWSTGPHLLYETRVNGQPENPLHFIKVSENDVQN